MPYVGNWEVFVHLAYLDESGTDELSPFAIYGALVIPHGKFSPVEMHHSTAIQQILPIAKIEDFNEFHACQLYRGTGPFEGIEDTKRFTAIHVLLNAVRMEELPYIYAAVDKRKFAMSPFGSAKPLNTAFHMCLLGVEDWATANHPQRTHPDMPKTKTLDWKDTVLYISDDFDERNKRTKEDFKKIYRGLRSKNPWVPPHSTRLWHAHDAMFFADSVDSVGIQMADLCNYFVKRRLAGEPEDQNFIDIFSKQIICAKPEPDWASYGGMFQELVLDSNNDANAKGQTA